MVLDGKGAIGLLRLVVFEKGADFVYEKVSRDGVLLCVNFSDGQPSCIVGHVLANLGVSGEVADRLDISGSYTPGEVATVLEKRKYEWQLDDDAVGILYTAQGRQDEGASWGEALADAEELFSRL